MKFGIGVFIFLLGLGAGFAGMQFIPASVSPYLPASLQGQNEIVKGRVVRKHQENERLLLTVSTPKGALLATFTQQIPEIDLLVEEQDEITLGLSHYAPFIRDPLIKGVMKPDHLATQPITDAKPDEQSLIPDESATPPVLSDQASREPQI